MSHGSQRILNRRIRFMENSGCDFENIHEFFGYKNTRNHIRKMSLIRQSAVNWFTLTVTQHKKELTPFQTYIAELPRDMNNLIYSFLHVDVVLKYMIEIPNSYPFNPINWELLSFTENGMNKNDAETNPKEMYCSDDFSPAMTFDAQILLHLSRLPWLQ